MTTATAEVALPVRSNGRARRSIGPKIRFLLVGGVNTVLGYGVFALLQFMVGARVGYVGALLLSHVIVSLAAFTFYRRFVFLVKGNALVDFLRFQSVYAVSLTLNVIALPLLVQLVHVSPYVGQAFSVVIVTISSYVGHKYFSFRRSTKPRERTDRAS